MLKAGHGSEQLAAGELIHPGRMHAEARAFPAATAEAGRVVARVETACGSGRAKLIQKSE